MNINLLVPKSLSIAQTLTMGFESLGHNVKIIDYYD